VTYRHKFVWPGCPWPPALDPNWAESADWRRERSARVWQAIQCWTLLFYDQEQRLEEIAWEERMGEDC
jgi:hypothetical protein